MVSRLSLSTFDCLIRQTVINKNKINNFVIIDDCKNYMIILIKQFLFLVLILLPFLGLTQTPSIEGIKRKLEQHPKQDSVRIELLTDYAFEVKAYDITKALQLCKEANEIAEKIKCEKCLTSVYYITALVELDNTSYERAIGLAKKALGGYRNDGNLEGESYSLNAIGLAYLSQGEMGNAKKYILQSAAIDEKRKDTNGIAGSYINIGNILAEEGKYIESNTYYLKAQNLKEKLKDELGIAMCLQNIGTNYLEQGNYPKALEYFKRVQYHYEKSGNSTYEAMCLLEIGSIYEKQEKYDKAFSIYHEVFDMNKGLKNKVVEGRVYDQMGGVFLKKKEYDKALNYISKALVINRSINDLKGVSANLNNIGEIYISKRKFSEAINSFEEAKKINEVNNLSLGLSQSYIGIAKVHYEQGNYSKALNAATSAQSIADESNLLAEQRDASEILSKIYAKMRRFDKAHAYHQLFKQYSDSLFNKERLEQIAQIEYDYKFQKEKDVFDDKEKKLNYKVESTSKDLERSQNRLLWGLVSFLVVLLIATLVIFQMRIRNVKTKSENSLLEQKLLRSQMTPHFIFNSLSVLQGMILNKEELKASNYLSKFSRLLRITLENSREKMTALTQELLALEHYVVLQNMESEKPFDYRVDIAENIKTDDIMIPPMLIQPFIENAIEHGFKTINEDKKIELMIYLKDNDLYCIIKDNGLGVEATKSDSSNTKKSLATSITKERIQLLSKEIKSAGSIVITDRKLSQEQGTIVTLVIPHKTTTK